MAKKITKTLKLQIRGGQATPAPPLGPTLGQEGVNIGDFVNQFNDKTKDMQGEMVRAIVDIFEDRTFKIEIKGSPASALIKKAAGVQKGSGDPKKSKVGKITKQQLKEIAEQKMDDLNARDVEAAMRILEGSARSMGIEVK